MSLRANLYVPIQYWSLTVRVELSSYRAISLLLIVFKIISHLRLCLLCALWSRMLFPFGLPPMCCQPGQGKTKMNCVINPKVRDSFCPAFLPIHTTFFIIFQLQVRESSHRLFLTTSFENVLPVHHYHCWKKLLLLAAYFLFAFYVLFLHF